MSEPISQAEQGPLDLPTGEAIPAAPAPTATPTSKPESSPSSSASSKPTPTQRNILALLLALPTKTDAFLAHLQRCLATPSGTDTLLLFLCYSTRLTGALANALSHALTHRTLAALSLTLPRGGGGPQTIAITTTTKSLPPTAALLAAALGARLKALGGLASEARTIARLWALLGMYSWAKRLVTTTPTTSVAVALIDWTQLLACTAFQVLENGAYLSSKNILAWTPPQQGRAYLLASRALAVHTGLELGKLLAKMVAANKSSNDDEKSSAAVEEEKAAAVAVRRSMAINLAWTPLILHWASETPFLSDISVGLGGCVPGVLQMRKLWKETAL